MLAGVHSKVVIQSGYSKWLFKVVIQSGYSKQLFKRLFTALTGEIIGVFVTQARILDIRLEETSFCWLELSVFSLNIFYSKEKALGVPCHSIARSRNVFIIKKM